jgi:hypothetical protein
MICVSLAFLYKETTFSFLQIFLWFMSHNRNLHVAGLTLNSDSEQISKLRMLAQ